jgi:ribosome-binding protein aMBF1 (putative translation factor)
MTKRDREMFTSLDRLQQAVEADELARVARAERTVVLSAARVIRDMRLQAGLTQVQLARLIGTQQPNIVRAERGEGTRGPTIDLLGRVANACGQKLILGWAPSDSAEELLKEETLASAHLIAM